LGIDKNRKKSLLEMFFIILVLAILIIAFIYVNGKIEPQSIDITDDEDIHDENGEDDQTDGKDNGDENWDNTHYVFVEIATSTWCINCPEVEEAIHELYESPDYPLYYVSLVYDGSEAKKRLDNKFNTFGYPTLYIDSGYSIVVGKKEKSEIIELLKPAFSRNVADIYINLSAEWDEETHEIIVEAKIVNNDTNTYKGFLKIFLTEIISTQWSDFEGNSIKHPFLGFVLEEDIEILPNQELNFSKTFNDAGLDPENIRLFSVVFNSNTVSKYSDPGFDEFPFEANYADAVAKAEVVEGGNLPPTIGIGIPTRGYIHLFGNPIYKSNILNFLFNYTYLIGKSKIVAKAEDDNGIYKVQFFIDGTLKKTDYKEPYEYSFNKIRNLKWLIGKHTITVKAFDIQGKTNTATLDKVLGFFL